MPLLVLRLRALLAQHPTFAAALFGCTALAVGALGLAALVTGLQDPLGAGRPLVVLGAAALVAVCWAADAGWPVGGR
jgi:hypothetical protein